MATSVEEAKKSVRVSRSLGSVRGTKWVRSSPGKRRAGVAKTRPSVEKKPSGRPAKRSSAASYGAPVRMEWRKAQRAAGYGRAGWSHCTASESKGGVPS